MVKKCLRCEIPFEVIVSTKKYCSAECRLKSAEGRRFLDRRFLDLRRDYMRRYRFIKKIKREELEDAKN